MNASSIAGTVALLSMPVIFAIIPACYAHEKTDMKASFNLTHDVDAAVVTIQPSVQADTRQSVDYRISIAKQGAAGTSKQKNGGRLDLVAGEDVSIGPVLRFGGFAPGDHLNLELDLCRSGSRCKQPDSVIAHFSSSYPGGHGVSK